MWNTSENRAAAAAAGTNEEEEEEGLRLAALQRSPTIVRSQTSIFRNDGSGRFSLVLIDKLEDQERKQVLDKIIKLINDDPEKFFRRVRQRFDA